MLRKILEFLINRHEDDDSQKDIAIDNWVKYCYKNRGFDEYCEMRIRRLQNSLTEKIKDRDEYIRDVSAVEEIKKMQFYVKAKFQIIKEKSNT